MKLPRVGAEFEGGYFGGEVVLSDKVFAVVWAPRANGLHPPAPWHLERADVSGAGSLSDSMANTRAMADAGCPLAEWALRLSINGQGDWCLPARDVLELAYRHFKPGTVNGEPNPRDGENPSSLPPRGPYKLSGIPGQTKIKPFRRGGAESFESDQGGMSLYWSSTQAGLSWAWMQSFSSGVQEAFDKAALEACAARAVRLERIGRIQVHYEPRPASGARLPAIDVVSGSPSAEAPVVSAEGVREAFADWLDLASGAVHTPLEFHDAAPVDSIREAERALGFPLPAELRALYEQHNGQRDVGPALFRPWFRLSTLQEMVSRWRSLQQVAAEIRESDVAASFDLPARWLPIGASETEQALFLDASRSSINESPAVFSWDLAGEPEPLASSVSALLSEQASMLRKGALSWSGDEWIVADHSSPDQ